MDDIPTILGLKTRSRKSVTDGEPEVVVVAQVVPEFRACDVDDLVLGAADIGRVDGHGLVCGVYYCFGGEVGHYCAADLQTAGWGAVDEGAGLAY